jgi:hypothetical protein
MEYFRFILHIRNRQLVTTNVISSIWYQDCRLGEAAVISSTVRHSSTYQLQYACSCNLFPTSSAAGGVERCAQCFGGEA